MKIYSKTPTLKKHNTKTTRNHNHAGRGSGDLVLQSMLGQVLVDLLTCWLFWFWLILPSLSLIRKYCVHPRFRYYSMGGEEPVYHSTTPVHDSTQSAIGKLQYYIWNIHCLDFERVFVESGTIP